MKNSVNSYLPIVKKVLLLLVSAGSRLYQKVSENLSKMVHGKTVFSPQKTFLSNFKIMFEFSKLLFYCRLVSSRAVV